MTKQKEPKISWNADKMLKPSRNLKETKKKSRSTIFGVFFTAGSWEKDTVNGAPGIFFGPSYFGMALVSIMIKNHLTKLVSKVEECKFLLHVQLWKLCNEEKGGNRENNSYPNK